jgi:hypothetical protein
VTQATPKSKQSPSKLNRDWHATNRMPTKATLDQRIAWHLEHSRHCACRPIPDKLLEQIKQRGIKIT